MVGGEDESLAVGMDILDVIVVDFYGNIEKEEDEKGVALFADISIPGVCEPRHLGCASR